MGEKATCREYFKVRFAVGIIAATLANKYGGTAPDLLSSRRAREKRDRRRYRASRTVFKLEKHRTLRYSPSSGNPRIQSTE